MGVTLRRMVGGGWIADDVEIPEGSTAEIYGDALILGGTIWGGTIRGGVFTKSPSCAQRSDGYMFVAKIIESGELRIWAGCRNFSWDDAVAHWSNPEHPHSAESLRIINFLKDQENATHHA
jgi:hypothetical protein